MPIKKENSRTIYESYLGRSIRNSQWQALKQQMKESDLPLTTENLRFVAKCKKVGPRLGVDAIALKQVLQTFCDLGEIADGVQLKQYIFREYPKVSQDKFYRVFRNCGVGFRGDAQYQVSDLGEVLYLMFSRR